MAIRPILTDIFNDFYGAIAIVPYDRLQKQYLRLTFPRIYWGRRRWL